MDTFKTMFILDSPWQKLLDQAAEELKEEPLIQVKSHLFLEKLIENIKKPAKKLLAINISLQVEVLEEEKYQLRNLPQNQHTKVHALPAEEQPSEKVEVKLII